MKSRNTFSALPVLTLLVILSGCASQMLSDDRLRTHTAPLVGVSATDLTIVSRSEQGTNTFYTVRTSAGAEYLCSINGGGVLAAGMVQGGQCTKKPEPPKPVSAITKPELDPTKKPVKR